MKQTNAVRIIISFAAAYFMSYSLRSVNAAIAPLLANEFELTAAQLGWLSSVYFLAFAALQLPLGLWLDKFGAQKTESVLLLVATAGAVLTAMANSLLAISVGRVLIGIGVSGNLMAPFSYFRRNFPASQQAKLAMWMLIAGTLGAIVATQPALQLAQWLGWRAVFWLSAFLLLVCAITTHFWAHETEIQANVAHDKQQDKLSLMQLIVHPNMARVIPTTIFFSGVFVALQSLWAGPWLTIVLGMSAEKAGSVLFLFNFGLLVSYVTMSFVSPKLEKRGFTLAKQSVTALCWFAASLCVLVLWRGELSWIMLLILAPCIPAVILMQTQTAMAFPANMAGRVLTTFNLVMFLAGFSLQWGIGLLVDLLQACGASAPASMAITFGCLALAQIGTLLWFIPNSKILSVK